MFQKQPNMGFSTLQTDFTDDGADSPTFSPTYIQVLESDLADWSTQGYVLVADDKNKVPDKTTWALYEYTSLSDESGNSTNDSLNGLSRGDVRNRNFSTSHTFTSGSADVIVADSADQINFIISLINGNTNWPHNQNAGTNRLENQGTLWSDFNQLVGHEHPGDQPATSDITAGSASTHSIGSSGTPFQAVYADELHGTAYYQDIVFKEKRCEICGEKFTEEDKVALTVVQVVDDDDRRDGTYMLPTHLECGMKKTRPSIIDHIKRFFSKLWLD